MILEGWNKRFKTMNLFIWMNFHIMTSCMSTQTSQIVYDNGTFQIKQKTKEQQNVNISLLMDVLLIF